MAELTLGNKDILHNSYYEKKMRKEILKIKEKSYYIINLKEDYKYFGREEYLISQRYIIVNTKYKEDLNQKEIDKIINKQIKVFYKFIRKINLKGLVEILFDIKEVDIDYFNQHKLLLSYFLIEKPYVVEISNKLKKRRKFLKRKGLK